MPQLFRNNGTIADPGLGLNDPDGNLSNFGSGTTILANKGCGYFSYSAFSDDPVDLNVATSPGGCQFAVGHPSPRAMANNKCSCLILLHRERGIATAGLVGYHLYLTVTEANGTTYVFEGQHRGGSPYGGPPLQATTADHPDPGGRNGTAYANKGNLRQTIGVVKSDTLHSCASYITSFKRIAHDINAEGIFYVAGVWDSNSVAYTLVAHTDNLYAPQDVNAYPHPSGVHTTAPGWGHDLYDCVQEGTCSTNYNLSPPGPGLPWPFG